MVGLEPHAAASFARSRSRRRLATVPAVRQYNGTGYGLRPGSPSGHREVSGHHSFDSTSKTSMRRLMRDSSDGGEPRKDASPR